MYDVITIGSATRDVFVRSRALQIHKAKNIPGLIEACFPFGAKIDVDELVLETGGGATNNAVTFARMAGLHTAAVTRVGADSAGNDIADALRRDRVATGFIQRAANERSGYSTILLADEAERTILTYRGASTHLDSRRINWSKLRAKLFHVSSLSGDLPLLSKIIAHAKRIGAKVYFNPGGGELKQGLKKLGPLLSKLDLLIVNREEAALLTSVPRANLKGLIGALRRITAHSVLTDGRAGAYAITQPATYFANIIPVRRVNVTGAGDAFGSAFAVGLFKYRDVKRALALGTLNATGVVQHTGAKVGILSHLPTAREMARVHIKKLSW